MTCISKRWINISTASNNMKHGDDQIGYHITEDAALIIVADGVTKCKVGWIASTLLVYHLKLKFLEALESGSHLSDDFIEELVVDAVKEFKKDINDLIEIEHRSLSFRLKEYIGQLSKQSGKNDSAVLDNINNMIAEIEGKLQYFCRKGLKEKLSKVSIEGDDFGKYFDRYINKISTMEMDEIDAQTTLSMTLLIPLENGKQKAKAFSYIIGDSIISLLRNIDKPMPVLNNKSDSPSSYISSRDGIVGNPYISSDILLPGDLMIVSTDGANIFYKPEGGWAGLQFVRAIKGDMPEASQDNLAERWLSFAKTRFELDDDASLIIAKLL